MELSEEEIRKRLAEAEFTSKETFEREDGKALLKEWGVEGDYIGVGHCALGYAAENGEAPAKPHKEGYIVRV